MPGTWGPAPSAGDWEASGFQPALSIPANEHLLNSRLRPGRGTRSLGNRRAEKIASHMRTPKEAVGVMEGRMGSDVRHPREDSIGCRSSRIRF